MGADKQTPPRFRGERGLGCVVRRGSKFWIQIGKKPRLGPYRTEEQARQAQQDMRRVPITEADFIIAAEWIEVESRKRVAGLVAAKRYGYATSVEKLIRLYVLPSLGRTRLVDLNAGMLDDLWEEMHLRRGLALSTIRNTKSALNLLILRALKLGLIKYNPVQLSEVPKGRKGDISNMPAERVKRTKLSDPALAALLRFIDIHADDQWVMPAAIMIHTGLRRGEVLGLRWIDIDPGNGTLSVMQQVTRVKVKDQPSRLEVGPVKTREANRTMPIGAELIALIARHYENTLAQRRSGLMFQNSRGGLCDPDKLTKWGTNSLFPSIGAAKGTTMHSLRHTHGSGLARAGVQPHDIAKRMGHVDGTTSQRLYIHAADEDAAEVLDKWDGWIQAVKAREA